MKKIILVVGINGFVGNHLARELHSRGYAVLGTGMDSVISSEISDLVDSYAQCDLTKQGQVAALALDSVDAVINLAGLAQVGASFGKEELYNKVNVEVHTNLIDQLRLIGKKIRIVAVSTGAVYDSAQPMPLTESSSLALSASPYALSKVLLEKNLQVRIDGGDDIVIARPFNHIGPGQLPGFILPDLTQKVLTQDKLVIGKLNTSRDYTDVRDVVRAYVELATSTSLKNTVYNVCSGVPVSRDQLIQKLISATGKTSLPIEIDESLFRPHDPIVIYGDSSRLQNETGWKPEIVLDTTIKDYVTWFNSPTG